MINNYNKPNLYMNKLNPYMNKPNLNMRNN